MKPSARKQGGEGFRLFLGIIHILEKYVFHSVFASCFSKKIVRLIEGFADSPQSDSGNKLMPELVLRGM